MSASSPTLGNAFVTLLTDVSYLPGALVVLNALRELHSEPRNFKIVCLVTPETVDARAIGALRNAGFDLVIGVEPISSGNAGSQGLNLMGRPDLDIALTKLHLFRLGSLFSTIIYLDADTLPLRPMAHLFDSTEPHVLSASPDIGWPDCFNSGVMVIRPRTSDFDGLRAALNGDSTDGNGNGSFDGADQGLLNQYFSQEGPGGQWNRLPFIYNVTPSSAYQYAPAYRHYAHKISLIHFIGASKPWKSLSYRPAGQSPSSSSYDYNSLVDRWYAVYDRNVRPTAAHEPNLAKRFTVPEHVAVWNKPQDQPSKPVHAQDIDSRNWHVDDLKAAILHGGTPASGHYTSLPLDGRVDLIAPKPPPAAVGSDNDSTPTSSRGSSTPRQHDHHHDQAAPTQHHKHHHEHHSEHHHHHKHRHHDKHHEHHHEHKGEHHHAHHHGHRHDNHEHHEHHKHHEQHEENHDQFPNQAWDASRAAPPKDSRPEMIVPMPDFFAPAWDQPVHTQATYYQVHRPALAEYPTLPTNVSTNDWYKEFTSSVPDPTKVQPVFPWEVVGGGERVTARVFPKAGVAPDQTQRPDPPAPVAPPPAKLVRAPQTPPAPAPKRSMEEAMASYTNAWDSSAAIGRWAVGLSDIGVGIKPRTSGLRTAVPSPRVPSTPTSRRVRNKKPVSSDGSGDGDDEGDGGLDDSNAHYRDKGTQTESKRGMSDATTQASPETTPTKETMDLPETIKVQPRPFVLQQPPRKSHRETQVSKSAAQVATKSPTSGRSFPTYNFPSMPSKGKGTPSSGRNWDSSTDVEIMRQHAFNRVVPRPNSSGRT